MMLLLILYKQNNNKNNKKNIGDSFKNFVDLKFFNEN